MSTAASTNNYEHHQQQEDEFANVSVDDPDLAWTTLSQTQQFLPVPTKLASSSSIQTKEQSCSTSAAVEAAAFTRIAFMSDTHGNHRKVCIPLCDVLIHAGDFTKSGEQKTVTDLADYFANVKHTNRAKDIICIAGNHDLSFHLENYQIHGVHSDNDDDNNGIIANTSKRRISAQQLTQYKQTKQNFQESCTYLQDQSTTLQSIHYYGSPWTPTYGHCWAFMKDRHCIHNIWDAIPSSTDVLITHGPPLGRGDRAQFHKRAGCVELLKQVQYRVKPRIHVFGHIHEDYGCSFDGKTLFVNASNCTVKYAVEQPCIVVDLPHNVEESAKLVLPMCRLSGEEVLLWLKTNSYHNLLPYFEHCKPLLDGRALVNSSSTCSSCLDLDDLANRLKMHSLKLNSSKKVVKWRQLKSELAMAMMHLRCESY